MNIRINIIYIKQIPPPPPPKKKKKNDKKSTQWIQI